jgi:DNA topoisomerase-1
MTNSLVIVESPAKCKKIEEYLGPGYKCMASFGHLRELKSLNDIDINNNYSASYNICDDDRKKKNIKSIRIAISKADEVFLATDDDREGESIAWHICEVFDLPVETTKRIIFHEITESALKTAIMYPKYINMNLVQSQQARQILDIIVGFKVTPTLWSSIASNNKTRLSAGRCQTPALRLIYDNYLEIKEAPGNKVYNTVGYFTNHCLPYQLNKEFEREEEIMEFMDLSIEHNHIFTISEPKKTLKQPPLPLTTSRIQQLASNEMKISPKETMKICQGLYEMGYITYMRTDSSKYCNEFICSTKDFILKTYNEERYINPDIEVLSNSETSNQENTKKSKTKKTNIPPPQEAHEAIRPTNISLIELSESTKVSAKERKMYKIIWERTLETCMSPAEVYQIVSNISSYATEYKYTFSSELMDFPGWKIVSQKNIKDAEKSSKEYNYLRNIKQGIEVKYKKITSSVTIKNLKNHYNEAKLVQALEEKGIGRPSTFSMIIDKIQEREYVKKQDVIGKEIECFDFSLEERIISKNVYKKTFGNEKNKLVIQPLGIMAIEFLIKNFQTIFSYDYTKEMENELDIISKGDKIWHELCDFCYKEIDKSIQNMGEIQKKEIKIDDENYYIIGKNGPVIKCMKPDKEGKIKITFKPVIKDIDLHKLENGQYKLEEIIDKSNLFIILGDYQENQLYIRKGKFGLYATWGDKSKNLSCFGNRPIENISFEDVKEILDKEFIVNSNTTDSNKPDSNTTDSHTEIKGTNIIRQISNNISIRKGNYGDYIFYKKDKMKKPLFFKIAGFKGDYKTCHNDILQNWINETYGVY